MTTQFHTRKLLIAIGAFVILVIACWLSYERVFRPHNYFIKDVINLPTKYKISEARRASEAVRNAVAADPEKFGVSPNDLHTIVSDKSVPSVKPGVQYVYLTQQINGIPIQNAQLCAVAHTESSRTTRFRHDARRQLIGDSEDPMKHIKISKPIFEGMALVKNAENCINTGKPELNAAEAVHNAAIHVIGINSPLPKLITQDDIIDKDNNPTQKMSFRAAKGISTIDISCELKYWKISDEVCDIRLTWEIIARPNNTHWLQMLIDSVDGSCIHVTNWVRQATFSVVPFPNESPLPTTNISNLDSNEPFPFGVNDMRPLSLESYPKWSGSAPENWLSIDGVLFSETRGNNVRVVVNLDQNQTNYYETGKTALATDPTQFIFDYSYQNISSGIPSDWTDAAIVNVFYWTNIMHDILYQYGFDEASGNFQEDNFGLGGLGGDSVNIEVQDPSADNNALFVITPDGLRPIMQLFLFNRSDAELVLEVENKRFNALPALFGPLEYKIVGANVIDTNGTECGFNDFAEDFADSIVVIDRGNCTFVEKVTNAQKKGALAVVVVDNIDENIFVMQSSGVGDPIVIPAVSMTKSDGEQLKELLPTDQSTFSLNLESASFIVRDSSFDNGVIVHEYCHGLSSRLTGGSTNSFCLDPYSYLESANEGWSDFCSLFVTATSNTGKTRTVGSYSSWDTKGIRAFPYSPDLDVNPLSYSHVNYMAGMQPAEFTHFLGTIFCTILWDLYWAIIDFEVSEGALGFNENKYESGIGGSNIAMLLVVEGLKGQPCQPSFVDSRDAILSADENLYDRKYKCLIWSVFARRGLGFSARSSPPDVLNVTEANDIPPDCVGPHLNLVSSKLEVSLLEGDGDEFLDNCEMAILKLQIENTGIGRLTNITLVALSSTSNATIIWNLLPLNSQPLFLEQGDIGEISVSFIADGLVFGEPFDLEASFVSSEINGSIDTTLSLDNTDTDLLFHQSYSWDLSNVRDDWTLVEGIFVLEQTPILFTVEEAEFLVTGAAFGPLYFDIEGAYIIDGNGLSCDDIDDDNYIGDIVIIDRGDCTFTEKVKSAQNRGAVAVIIANNDVFDDPFIMSGYDNEIIIPSVMMSHRESLFLRTLIPTNATRLLRNSATYSVSSSASTPNQCDHIRSPEFFLHGSSSIDITLSYDIEDSFSGEWFDRANVALFDGERRIVIYPDEGNAYRASGTGPFVDCPVSGEDGFAGSSNGTKLSHFSSIILRATNLTNKVVSLDFAYGTDMLSQGKGISIQQIILYNVSSLVADKNTPCSLDISSVPSRQPFDRPTSGIDLIGPSSPPRILSSNPSSFLATSLSQKTLTPSLAPDQSVPTQAAALIPHTSELPTTLVTSRPLSNLPSQASSNPSDPNIAVPQGTLSPTILKTSTTDHPSPLLNVSHDKNLTTIMNPTPLSTKYSNTPTNPNSHPSPSSSKTYDPTFTTSPIVSAPPSLFSVEGSMDEMPSNNMSGAMPGSPKESIESSSNQNKRSVLFSLTLLAVLAFLVF